MITLAELGDHLLRRLREVQERLGGGGATAQTAFAEAVDSMGLVEFVGVVAADCGVKPDEIEQAVGRRFTTVADLARAMSARRLVPRGERATQGTFAFAQQGEPAAGLAAWSTYRPMDQREAEASMLGQTLPERSNEEIDALLGRPPGWLEQHAGIRSRWLWDLETTDAENAAAHAASACLDVTPGRPRSQLRPRTLLVTGEAPPRPLGQAAALHHLLGLSQSVPALDVGGACTGLIHCLWLAQRLVRAREPVLIVSVEAPTRWLPLRPGPEGESAALFGDAAGACVLTTDLTGGALPLRDLLLGCDGSERSLIEVEVGERGVGVRMDGPALALRAVDQLAAVVRQVCERNDVEVADLEAVYVHAGNGRMPPLIARKLNLPEDRVISTTPFSGNLGSVSLLAALSHRPPRGDGPVVLAAVGAGLNWGAALFDARLNE